MIERLETPGETKIQLKQEIIRSIFLQQNKELSQGDQSKLLQKLGEFGGSLMQMAKAVLQEAAVRVIVRSVLPLN